MSEILSREEFEAGAFPAGYEPPDVVDAYSATIEALAAALTLGIGKVEDVCMQIHRAVREGKRDEIMPDLIAYELERWIEGQDADYNSDGRDKTTFEVVATLREKGWLHE